MTWLFVFCCVLGIVGAPIPHEKGTQILGLGINVLNMEVYSPILRQDFDEQNYNVENNALLPLYVTEYGVPGNELSTYSEVIDQMSDYTNHINVHIEGETKFWIIKASFSGDYEKVATQVSHKNHKVAVVHSSVTTNMIVANPSAMQFSPDFENLIYRISYCIDKNTDSSLTLAKTYANQMIRLYGTHVIFKALLGASVTQTIIVDTTKLDTYNKDVFKAEAGASLSSFFSMKGSYKRDSSLSEKYASAIVNTQITSKGGDPWHVDWKYNDWIDTVKDRPDIVKLYLIHLPDLITPHRLPNISAQSLQLTLKIINDAVNQHIIDNTHHGCMDPTSPSYSYRANVEGGCLYNATFSYGGSYQISTPPDYVVNNLITNKAECPHGFNAYALHPSTPVPIGGSPGVSHEACMRNCFQSIPGPSKRRHECFMNCQNHPNNGVPPTVYTIQSFVCLASPAGGGAVHGVYFGGVYSAVSDNVVTGTKKCPDSYLPRQLYGGVTICEATFDSGRIDIGVHPGGMFTSYLKNPYTDEFWCPGGYERHSLGTSQPGYEFIYCIGIKDLTYRREFTQAGRDDPEPSFIEKYYPDHSRNNTAYYIVQIDTPASYKEQVESIDRHLLNSSIDYVSSDYVGNVDRELDIYDVSTNKYDLLESSPLGTPNNTNSIAVWIILAVVLLGVLVVIIIGAVKLYNNRRKHRNIILDYPVPFPFIKGGTDTF